jgi:hypothetical protein
VEAAAPDPVGAAAVLANGYESLHGACDACEAVLAGAVVAVAVFVKTLV